jgi:hypothetical protein
MGWTSLSMSSHSHPSSFLSPTSYCGHTPSLYNGDHLPYVGSLSMDLHWISVRPLPWTLTVLERTNPSVDSGPTDGTGTTPDLGTDQLRDFVFIIFPTQPHITDFNIRVPIRRWNPLTQHVSHFTICMLLFIRKLNSLRDPAKKIWRINIQ